MSTKTDNGYKYITCDEFGCTERTSGVFEGEEAAVEHQATDDGWEILPNGHARCPDHTSWKRQAGFNLNQFLQKKANYDGAQGYFVLQRRAWMNCVRCKLNDKKSAQESWQECLDEYQKDGNQQKWFANHIADKVVRTASCGNSQLQDGQLQARISHYRDDLKLTAGQAVMRALNDCAADAGKIPSEKHLKDASSAGVVKTAMNWKDEMGKPIGYGPDNQMITLQEVIDKQLVLVPGTNRYAAKKVKQ